MKIAVISDIHGNMEAIEAVMRDIEEKGAEKVFVLGDYAMAGPEPASAVDFFMSKLNDPKFTMIQGNTDLMIADYTEELYNKLKEKAPVMAEALKNDAQILNPIQKGFLKNLPIQKEVECEKVKFLLVHGSPRKIMKIFFLILRWQKWKRCLRMLRRKLFFADILIFLADFRHLPDKLL